MSNLTKRQFFAGSVSGLVFAIFGGSAWAQAKTHIVEMLNKSTTSNDRMVFEPPVLQVGVGDTVKFASTDPGHNSEANKDMLPEGVKAWKGRIGEEIEVTFDTPGVYGYHCTPHRSTGMVGLILVGDVDESDLEPLMSVRQRGKAKSRFEDYFAQAKALIG